MSTPKSSVTVTREHVLTMIDAVNRSSEKALEKYVHADFVLFAASVAVTSFSKLNWSLWRLYGWNLRELEDLLDLTFNQLRYSAKLRFWK